MILLKAKLRTISPQNSCILPDGKCKFQILKIKFFLCKWGSYDSSQLKNAVTESIIPARNGNYLRITLNYGRGKAQSMYANAKNG